VSELPAESERLLPHLDQPDQPLMTEELPLRILLVDDHEVVTAGLTAALEGEEGMRVVSSAASGAQALVVAREVRPTVAIVDYRLPDISGAELCRQLKKLEDPPVVIVLSTYLSEEIVREAFAAGAQAFVTKASGLAELKRELRAIAAGTPGPPDPPRVVARLHRLMHSELGDTGATPQQAAVIRLAAKGLTNREIGARLYVSEATVRFHLQSLKRRLGARNRVGLVVRAIEDGIIEPNEDI
jgi:DNA-binding NarL/FixJ family response regulator